MANIRVDLDFPIIDGSEAVFIAPCDCSDIAGLVVYYPSTIGANATTRSKEFIFKDAHGSDLSGMDHLFKTGVYVKVLLNVTEGIAYIQNADTNSYIEGKFNFLANRPVNNNILINSNFANPINQREYVSGTVASADIYTIDRWAITSGMKIELNTNGITLEMTTNDNDGKGWFLQRLEDTNFLTGKTVTYSAKINEVVYSNTVTLNKTSGLQGTIVSDGFNMYMGYTPSKDAYDIDIELQKDSSITIEWIKLELGDHATPYVPRPYQEEWLLCQRYYQIIDAGTSSCHGLNSNLIIFVVRPYIKMRAKGTPINNNLAVKKDNATLTGFTFSFALIDASIGFINIQASKTSHGVGVTNLPNLSGTFSVDAEL